MKFIKLFLCLMAMIIVINSCSDDNNVVSDDITSLRQTVWNGLLIDNSNGVRNKYNLRVYFTEEVKIDSLIKGKGYYSISDTIPMSKLREDGIYYTLKDKIMEIESGNNNLLIGRWWFYVKNNKELELKRDIDNINNADSLILKREL